ncbi:voltage-gated potassium channel [Eubacterium uniforme]|uniref:Voltage-gated potassium channel n=1 Tax=Eubacterium uniforme TaxID=39495 RepID=A0A1T4VUP3_9FIRM|nr:ion transporter [Eubacterium uniforme]SKA68558.1 voltage-gated potassium channel [Eubacterium uniforme]
MSTANKKSNIRKSIFDMVSVGVVDKPINQFYDIVSTVALILNLAVAILSTFDQYRSYKDIFILIESITMAIFAIDYVLRLISAKYAYPMESELGAIRSYVFSFFGLVDLLSFLPYYLPVVFPAGAVAFRMIRVVRILRLFRVNAYYDSINVIRDVILAKKQQLFSSIFIILVLMMGSSLCMYSLEHEAQPDVFENAFSGLWWATSTLLTVGYGDIYPITTAGKAFGIIIAFLGVGMVAIPTGIISAGFVEQYGKIKRVGEYAREEDVNFININLVEGDILIGKKISEITLPKKSSIAFVIRGRKTVMPNEDVVLDKGDNIVISADDKDNEYKLQLREIEMLAKHRWVGQMLKDIDISRQTHVVMIKRGDNVYKPSSKFILKEGDKILVYSSIKNMKDDYGELYNYESDENHNDVE